MDKGFLCNRCKTSYSLQSNELPSHFTKTAETTPTFLNSTAVVSNTTLPKSEHCARDGLCKEPIRTSKRSRKMEGLKALFRAPENTKKKVQSPRRNPRRKRAKLTQAAGAQSGSRGDPPLLYLLLVVYSFSFQTTSLSTELLLLRYYFLYSLAPISSLRSQRKQQSVSSSAAKSNTKSFRRRRF